MTRKPVVSFTLYAVLLVSLVINLFNFLSDNPTELIPEYPPEYQHHPVDCGKLSTSLESCLGKLRQCKSNSLEPQIGLTRIVDLSIIKKTPETILHPLPDAHPFNPLPEVDAALQKEVLDTIARNHLRGHWSSQQKAISKTLLKDLQDGEKRAVDLQRDIDEVATLLKLNDDETNVFRSRYEQIRGKRIARVLENLDHGDIDYRVFHGQLKAFFSDEDQLVGSLYGDKALKKLRLARLESRTALLAIAATFANLSWDNEIAW